MVTPEFFKPITRVFLEVHEDSYFEMVITTGILVYTGGFYSGDHDSWVGFGRTLVLHL